MKIVTVWLMRHPRVDNSPEFQQWWLLHYLDKRGLYVFVRNFSTSGALVRELPQRMWG